MKRIGIITFYYKSKNYGGNLQAYALCEVLLKQGYAVEQISFPRIITTKKRTFFESFLRRDFFKICFRKIFHTVRNHLINLENKRHQIDKRRANAFFTFNQKLIPHSEQIYSSETISQCVEDYDVFITGSDQVWNLWGDAPSYLLDFVPSGKIKMSYAASIARDSLTDEQKEIFRKSLKDYKAVSVREKSAEILLKDLSPVEVQTVLDPTLLLTRDDWDKVCSERVVNENYVFCYFLGNNKKERKLAKKFAKAKGLKLVTLPHTAGIKHMDMRFGDEQLYDASPEQFISLIKHADYIFTDSFHAVVFSNIYKKQYFVFNRSKKGEMSSRITDITELFHQQERFCNGKEREVFKYISALPHIDYTRYNADFEKSRINSIEFLRRNLED